MSFETCLMDYMNLLEVSGEKIAENSGLSPSAISRYRRGERTVHVGSPAFEALVRGICMISQEKNAGLTEGAVRKKFTDALIGLEIPYEDFLENLNYLMDSLNIHNVHIARAINFDASHISRIRRGVRKPSNVREFISDIASFTAKKTGERPGQLAGVLGISGSDLITLEQRRSAVEKFLSSYSRTGTDQMLNFLYSIDSYVAGGGIENAAENTEAGTIFLPEGNYYGIEAIKDLQMAFLGEAVRSKKGGNIYLFSELPIEELSKDKDFYFSWISMLKKTIDNGFEINVIHNINRPAGEMLIGLESWIPLYMTGKVHAYYLPESSQGHLIHLICVSEYCALTGLCTSLDYDRITLNYLLGKDAEGAFLTGKHLAENSPQLMKVYTEHQADDYQRYLDTEENLQGIWSIVCTDLPLFTMPEDLLMDLMNRNNFSSDDKTRFLENWRESREHVLKMSRNGQIEIVIQEQGKENFEGVTVTVPAGWKFDCRMLELSYDDYKIHLENTESFALKNAMTIRKVKIKMFRNIKIVITHGSCVAVSGEGKGKLIHFHIGHPRMVRAFEILHEKMLQDVNPKELYGPGDWFVHGHNL